MRITIDVDSATPEEVYDLTMFFQRTTQGVTQDGEHELPAQITKQPTVRVAGMTMGWVSPALRPEHAFALLEQFEAERRLKAELRALDL